MFRNDFPDFLDFCNNLSGNCIILEDVNVHFDSPNSPYTAKLLDSLDMFNFSQAVNEPTHERGHTLDWVMFRPEDNVLCSTSATQLLLITSVLFVTLLCTILQCPCDR